MYVLLLIMCRCVLPFVQKEVCKETQVSMYVCMYVHMYILCVLVVLCMCTLCMYIYFVVKGHACVMWLSCAYCVCVSFRPVITVVDSRPIDSETTPSPVKSLPTSRPPTWSHDTQKSLPSETTKARPHVLYSVSWQSLSVSADGACLVSSESTECVQV